MDYIDPLKVVRNPATLKAYRQYQRDALAAGQPWLTIAIVAVVLELGVLFFALNGVFALYRGGFRASPLIFLSLTVVYGLCFLIASVRIWLYRRSHPLVLPEPPSAFG